MLPYTWPFVVEELEGLLDVVAFLQSLGLLVLPPLMQTAKNRNI